MLHDIKFRICGLAMALGSASLGWFVLSCLFRNARNGAAEIFYSPKILLFIPLCFIFGLAFLAYGSRLSYRNATGTNLTFVGWVLFSLSTAITAGGFWWLNVALLTLGYR